MKSKSLKIGFILAWCLIWLTGCGPSYLSRLGRCRLNAVQDFRFSDYPKRIVIGHTGEGSHAQTELYRDGKWIPARPDNWYDMVYIFKTYYDLDTALKSGWLLSEW